MEDDEKAKFKNATKVRQDRETIKSKLRGFVSLNCLCIVYQLEIL